MDHGWLSPSLPRELVGEFYDAVVRVPIPSIPVRLLQATGDPVTDRFACLARLDGRSMNVGLDG
jgi:hypothetical protein